MTASNALNAAIDAVASALGSARGAGRVSALRALLRAASASSVGEHLIFCVYIDLKRGRLSQTVTELLAERWETVADLASLSAAVDSVADTFDRVASAITKDAESHVYAAVWSLDRCHGTFVPPTRPKDLERFRRFLESDDGAEFSTPVRPIVSRDRPLGWVTAFPPTELVDRQSAARIQLSVLIEELGLPWRAGKHTPCLVVFPAPLTNHASLGVPTALSCRWNDEGMFVSNDREEEWGQTRARTLGTHTGRRERVHSEIGAGDLSPAFFVVAPPQDVTLAEFSQALARDTARIRSALV